MRSPFDGGLGPGGARTLYVLGLIAAVKAVALIGIAEALARGIAHLFAGSTDVTTAVQLGAAAVLARAAATWAGQWFAARASLGAKEQLRARLADRLIDDPSTDVGAATVLATRGLDDLDPYYRTVLPAAMGAAVIPLTIGLRILAADWLSALIVALTVPLIPVFMILIGQHTRDRVDEAAGALERLSDHLVELARGLPVLVGLGRVAEQAQALRGISDDHRRRTLATLRTAFLSALALELIATISVALVAVTIGIRLVGGDLPLEVGLLVLILAPECYAPLREVGTAFHAAQDGIGALRRSRDLLSAPVALAPVATTGWHSNAHGRETVVDVRGVEILFAGRRDPVRVPHLRMRGGETVALTGPSGAGKSTVLRLLAGRLATGRSATVTGESSIDGPVAWLSQHPRTIGDTVLDEMRRWATPESEPRIGGLLSRLNLGHLTDSAPAALSPGEIRRLAVARILLRVEAGAHVVLLDEPTAHLDDDAADAVVALIGELRGGVALILVSHDPRVLALAEREIAIGGESVSGPADEASPSDHAAPARARPAGSTSVVDADTARLALSKNSDRSAGRIGPERPAEASEVLLSARGEERRTAWRELGRLLRPVAGRLVGSVLLGTVAALSAAALTATSGWLIVRAAEQPPIMYLLVAIVGVRFFGLARSVLRYAERLVTHDAVFASTGALRHRLWMAVAARGTASPALRTTGAALDTLVTTADRIRDLVPRVVVPPLVGLVTAGAGVLAVALLHAPAAPFLLVALVMAMVVAPIVALVADRRAGALEGALRSDVTRRLANLLGAADDLRANGVDTAARAEVAALDARAGRLARRGAGATGLAGAVVVLALAGCAVAMLAVSTPAVAAGQLSVEVVAVLALLPLALIDPAVAVVDAVQQAPDLFASIRREQPVLDVPTASGGGTGTVESIDALLIDDLSARWPESRSAAFAGVTADVSRGEWLAVTGPSGSGKSTLLSVLLGYLHVHRGGYRIDDSGAVVDATTLAAVSLRSHLAWCPQEAHVFASTIRGNLLLGRGRDDPPSETEMFDALDAVGLGTLVREATDGLNTPVGSGGSGLSGGERQRLAVARALLARADVVLLDEPTAHLDGPTADGMMRDLRGALADRTVVLVSHRAADLLPTDVELRLGERKSVRR